MALTQDESAALARATDLNKDPYDAQTNPGGLGGRGYKSNWPQSARDLALLADAAVREQSGAAVASADAQAAALAAELAGGAADGVLAESVNARDVALADQTAAEEARDAALAARGGAEVSGGAATAAWESLKARYLGALADEPLGSGSGAALVPGMLYFNTTSGRFRGWTGEVWTDLVGMGENNTLPAGDSAHRLAGYRLSSDGSTVEYFRYALEPRPDAISLSEPDIYTGMASFTVNGYPAGFGPARVQALGDVVLSVDDGVTWQPVAEAENGTTVLVRPSAEPMVDRTTYVGTLQAGGVDADYSFFYRSLFVDTPSITSHGDGQVNVEDEPFFVASPYDVLPGEMKDGEHPHQDTDWQLYADAGLTDLVWSTMGNASNKVQIQGPPLTEATTYYLRVRYRSATGLVSAWSDVVSFTTAVTFGPVLLTTDDGYKVYKHDVENVYAATSYYGTGEPQRVRTNMPYREGDRVLTIIKSVFAVRSWIVLDSVRGPDKYLSFNNWLGEQDGPELFDGWSNGGLSIGVGDTVNAVDELYQVQTFKEADGFFKIVEIDHVAGGYVVDLPSLGTIGMVWLKAMHHADNQVWWIWQKGMPTGSQMLQWGAPWGENIIHVSGSTVTLTYTLMAGKYILYVWADNEAPSSLIRFGSFDRVEGQEREIDVGFPVQTVLWTNTGDVQAYFCSSTFGSLSYSKGLSMQLYFDAGGGMLPLAEPMPGGFRTGVETHPVYGEPVKHLYMAIRASGSAALDVPEQVYLARSYMREHDNFLADLGFMPHVCLWRTPQYPLAMQLTSPELGVVSQLGFPCRPDWNGIYDHNTWVYNVASGGLLPRGSLVMEGHGYEVAGFHHHPGVFFSQIYQGTGAARDIPHFLESAPELILVANFTDIQQWVVYSAALTASHVLELETSDAAWEEPGIWGEEPTATAFSVGASPKVNGAEHRYFCMMFASREGMSKVGDFTTDASGNATIAGLQFRPRFLLVKSLDAAGDWYISGMTDAMTPTTAPGVERVMTLNTTYGFGHTLDWVDTSEDGFVIKQRTPSARHLFVALA